MKRDEVFPRWARELERYLPVKSLYFLHANIHDRYPWPFRTTTVSIPGLQQSPRVLEWFQKNSGRFTVEGESVTAREFLYSAEREHLIALANETMPIIKGIEKLYSESRDFGDIATPAGINWSTRTLSDWLNDFLLLQGYSVISLYDIVDGFVFPDSNPEMKSNFDKLAQARESRIDTQAEARGQAARSDEQGPRNSQGRQKTQPAQDIHRIRTALANTDIATAVVIRYFSRTITSPTTPDADENRLFVSIMKAADEAGAVWVNNTLRRNILILVCDRINDLPPWLYLGNPMAKQLQIDLPDQYWRRLFFSTNRTRFHTDEALSDEAALADAERVFCDMTSGMTTTDMHNIRSISRNEQVSIRMMRNIIERYKFGIIESEWDKIEHSKLEQAQTHLERRVRGQPVAVQHVLDIIKRSATGLSGIQQSAYSNRPRGVLFFAGPTGVGKTEMAKAIAELLFGDDKRCIRFDMSEYAAEHADQRLLGAPPGYVGYEEGGQLTNAVRSSPFSVLLFDEIEKAHERILDKFLQIIDDGRLTDGRGETVYFSESIIIFTSNLGVMIRDDAGHRVPNTDPDMDYDQLSERIRDAIHTFFSVEINRPELYNRFGENFVVFDYIREGIVGQIVDKILDTFVSRLERDKKISTIFSPAVREFLTAKGMENRDNGGRGIGNIIERYLVNPFARHLFDNRINGPAEITVTRIDDSNPKKIVLEVATR